MVIASIRHASVIGFSLLSTLLISLECAAQSAPPVPSNLQCLDSRINVVGGHVVAQVDIDPISVDIVSFMVARADDPETWPFVHYSVPVGLSDGATVVGTIPGLEAGVEYLLMARAHSRNQTTSYYVFWSDVAHMDIPCKAVGAGGSGTTTVAAAPKARTESAADTMWIEVFRHNANGPYAPFNARNNITLPDYVESHNTGDLAGIFSNIRSLQQPPPQIEKNSSYTRYCIEMQIVELPQFNNATVPSQFADYNSCEAGSCHCMSYNDRVRIAFQPREQVAAECDKTGFFDDGHCEHCLEERLAQSAKYIGMTPIYRGINGRWYSHPAGGSCAPGGKIGDDGCTYRLSPLSHSLSHDNLYNNKGVYNLLTWRPGHWAQIARAAFDDIGAEPCGGAADVIREQILI